MFFVRHALFEYLLKQYFPKTWIICIGTYGLKKITSKINNWFGNWNLKKFLLESTTLRWRWICWQFSPDRVKPPKVRCFNRYLLMHIHKWYALKFKAVSSMHGWKKTFTTDQTHKIIFWWHSSPCILGFVWSKWWIPFNEVFFVMNTFKWNHKKSHQNNLFKKKLNFIFNWRLYECIYFTCLAVIQMEYFNLWPVKWKKAQSLKLYCHISMAHLMFIHLH